MPTLSVKDELLLRLSEYVDAKINLALPFRGAPLPDCRKALEAADVALCAALDRVLTPAPRESLSDALARITGE